MPTQSHCVVLTFHVNFLVALAKAGCRTAADLKQQQHVTISATIANDAADKRAAKVFSIELYQHMATHTARTM
jgi:hypothetical protein